MNRRNFLTLIGGVSAAAAVRTWPFRVYSFPTDIVIAKPPNIAVSVADGDSYGTIQVVSPEEFARKYPQTAKRLGIGTPLFEGWVERQTIYPPTSYF